MCAMQCTALRARFPEWSRCVCVCVCVFYFSPHRPSLEKRLVFLRISRIRRATSRVESDTRWLFGEIHECREESLSPCAANEFPRDARRQAEGPRESGGVVDESQRVTKVTKELFGAYAARQTVLDDEVRLLRATVEGAREREARDEAERCGLRASLAQERTGLKESAPALSSRFL